MFFTFLIYSFFTLSLFLFFFPNFKNECKMFDFLINARKQPLIFELKIKFLFLNLVIHLFSKMLFFVILCMLSHNGFVLWHGMLFCSFTKRLAMFSTVKFWPIVATGIPKIPRVFAIACNIKWFAGCLLSFVCIFLNQQIHVTFS